TVVGLRELNIKGIPKRNWINDHFTYTHGYGATPARTADEARTDLVAVRRRGAGTDLAPNA
ncbi:UPF0182 family protein, partial [Streptomyces tanashiensis]